MELTVEQIHLCECAAFTERRPTGTEWVVTTEFRVRSRRVERN